MKVSKLIERLEELPQDLDVMLDASKDNSEWFRLEEVMTCEMIKIDNIDQDDVVLLSSSVFADNEDENEN
jgi:hypothetical protein